jgi:Flp pilus assembly protein TadD
MTPAPKAPPLWLAPLVVVLAAGAAYVRGLDGPFLFDDRTLFDANGEQAPFALSSRPVVWLSVALNRAISGSDTWSYHAFNVAVHALAGLLVLALGRRVLALLGERTGRAVPPATAVFLALLWTLHPLQTQAVAYIVQRAEALGGVLALGTVVAFLRGAGSTRAAPWWVLSLACLALGVATKEWVAMTPLVVLLVDRVLLARGWREPWAGRLRYHGLALALLPFLFWLFVRPQLIGSRTAGLTLQDFGPLEYLRTQPGVLLEYLRLVVWPHPLCLDRGWPITPTWSAALLPGAAVVALLGASAWSLARGRAGSRFLGLAGAWFFLFLAPTSSLVPIKDPAVEHRLYVALLAPLAIGVWAIARTFQARPALAHAVLLVLCTAAGLATAARVEDYRSGVRMWRATVACAPHHARAWTNLGEELVRADLLDEAIDVLTRALELDPESGQAALNLGTALMRTGRTADAVAPYRRAVRFLESAKTHRNLANALLLAGDAPGAEAEYRAAIAAGAEPDDHYWLAVALQRQGRLLESVPEFEAFLRERPDHADGHSNLAVSLSRLERRDEAQRHYRRAVELDPDAWAPRVNLAHSLEVAGDRTGARRELEEAVRRAPGRPEPLVAAARFALADPQGAEEALERITAALRLVDGERPELLEVLALALEGTGRKDEARSTWARVARLAPPGSPLARRARERLE